MDKLQAQTELINLVKKEVSDHKKEQFWITDKVALNMREVIKQCRKNYWGVYDVPIDPISKQEKMWVPLTRLLCDAVRKGVNTGPKDIRFRAKRSRITDMVQVVRGYMRDWMSKNHINFALDQLVTVLTIDGTRVWKTYWDGTRIVRKDVDVLNVYIDPTSDDIQSAYRFTERSLYSKSSMVAMTAWENTSSFKVDEDLQREGDNASVKKGEYGDVYECWGKFPKNLILSARGEKSDDTTEVDAQVVISGIDTNKVLFHYADINTNKDKNGIVIKPYEEAWYLKIPGCWYGLSVAWTLIPLQNWINTIINLRIKKNTIAQIGLLKIKKGSGVNQHMLNQLISNGVIELNDPDKDMEQLQIAESGQSSYEDERTAKQWAQEVASVFDLNLGDLPASTSATGAAIQSQQSNTAMTLVIESIEYFVKRWMDRHVLQFVPELIKKEGYVTFFKDFDDIKRIRERVVAKIALEQLNKMVEEGNVPSEQNLMAELQRAQRQLEEDGDLFIKVVDDIITEAMDTEVFMTNADLDIGVTVRNLLELRNGMPPEVMAEMTAEALDLLGLQVPSSLRNPNASAQPGGPVAPPGLVPDADPALVTEANTLNNEQR